MPEPAAERQERAAKPIADALTEALRERSDVRVAILFGSEARGTATEGSDVDLAVLGPSVDRLALAADLTRVIDREVQVVDLSDPGVVLLQAIIQDGMIVHEATFGEGALFWSRALTTLETDLPWYRRMSDAWLEKVAREGLS